MYKQIELLVSSEKNVYNYIYCYFSVYYLFVRTATAIVFQNISGGMENAGCVHVCNGTCD